MRAHKDAYGDLSIGLLNEKNRLHGRGVKIDRNNMITVGYWVDGSISKGNYIYAFFSGG